MTDKGTLESGIDVGLETNIGPEKYKPCSVFCFAETVVTPPRPNTLLKKTSFYLRIYGIM